MNYLAKALVIIGFGVGVGFLSWAVAGMSVRDIPLIQFGAISYMDVRGAIGIGAGFLTLGILALVLLRRKPN